MRDKYLRKYFILFYTRYKSKTRLDVHVYCQLFFLWILSEFGHAQKFGWIQDIRNVRMFSVVVTCL